MEERGEQIARAYRRTLVADCSQFGWVKKEKHSKITWMCFVGKDIDEGLQMSRW